GQVHTVFQVIKSHFRLDHPELCQMPGGIGVFCPEGRSEGIDVPKRHRSEFAFQLSGDSQVSSFSEKVFTVVYTSIRLARWIIHVQRSYLEHFSGTFSIRAGDHRCVDVDKTLLVEKLMDRKCQCIPY